MLACSACNHVLPTGATRCPTCGILLTAQAVPAIPKRTPLWVWLLGAFGLFYLVCAVPEWIMAPTQRAKDEAAQAASDAAIKKKMAFVDSLNTPAAFEKSCGPPTRTLHRVPASDAAGSTFAVQHAKTVLIYRRMQADMDVIFTRDPDAPTAFREHRNGKVYLFDPYEALVDIGCTLSQDNATPSAAKSK